MRQTHTLLAIACTLALAGCSKTTDESTVAPTGAPEVAATIPASLSPFGAGFPKAGDPCRTLGESPITADWLDDSARLVGCTSPEDAAALGGRTVATVEGVTIVSIPMGDANAGMVETETLTPPVPATDAKVSGTDYNATSTIKCGFKGAAPTQSCPVGVKRNWGENGTNLVEVTKPDGRKRAIFFDGTKPTGADSAQSDGSAGWDFDYTRSGDEVTVKFGPETYVIVDAMVEGG